MKKVESRIDRRLDRLEKALWRLSDEVAVLRSNKHNPAREQLEKRVLELENKFFAFQCGAQAQMERDQQAAAIRETLGARGAN